jgi:hypothetical protein
VRDFAMSKLKRRVFISATYDTYLDDKQNSVKWGIVQRVIDAGYEPHIFFSVVPDRFATTARREVPWTTEKVMETIRGACGAVLIGYPRWNYGEHAQASEFTHYEAGVVYAIGIPVLHVLEQGILWRGGFDPSSAQICEVPRGADDSWLKSTNLDQFFSKWRADLQARYDIFLGYSGKSTGTAKNLMRVLKEKGVKVLDWQEFPPGTILEQIKKAAALCTGGMFLFTADDDLVEGGPGMAAPRDNVVFEAGYFIHAKGHQRVLIIRESGEKRSAKMPADLGGAIYAPFPDLSNIEALDQQIDRFVENL